MTATDENPSKDKKQHTTKNVLIGLAVWALLIFGALQIFGGSNKSGADDKKPATQASQQSKKTATTDLATRVDKTLKKNLGAESYIEAGAPFQYINGMKDQGSGWVDVNYQTDCDKDQATFVAKQVMGTVGADITDLETVNVTCTNGTSSYATRDGMFTN